MAKETPPAEKSALEAPKTHKKLARLPATHKIQKRPLLHPAIPSPKTSSQTQKVLYISARSPFISTIKRLRKLLSHIESRATGPVTVKGNPRSVYRQIEDSLVADKKAGKGVREEEVMLKATGKAIESLLSVAVWAQGQPDLRVRFATGSVGAIDDVLAKDENAEVEGEAEVEEIRVRRTSCLEVYVGLR